MREEIGYKGLIVQRAREHSDGIITQNDFLWYMQTMHHAITTALTHADKGVDRGLLQASVIRSVNEQMLGWDTEILPELENNPLSSIAVHPQRLKVKYEQSPRQELLEKWFESPSLSKLGMTIKELFDLPYDQHLEIVDHINYRDHMIQMEREAGKEDPTKARE